MRPAVKFKMIENRIFHRHMQARTEELAARRRSTDAVSTESGRGQPLGSVLKCPFCENKFRKKKPRQKYCSPDCRVKAQRLRDDRGLYDKLSTWHKGNPSHEPSVFARCPRCNKFIMKAHPNSKYCVKCSEKMQKYKYRKDMEIRFLKRLAKEQAQYAMDQWGDMRVEDIMVRVNKMLEIDYEEVLASVD